MFRGGPPVKIVFLGVKYNFFGGVPSRICIPGANIMLLGSLQPTDMKKICGNSVKGVQFPGKTADLATLVAPHGLFCRFLGNFLDLECGRNRAVYGGSESSRISKNILICVLKMNGFYGFGTRVSK